MYSTYRAEDGVTDWEDAGLSEVLVREGFANENTVTQTQTSQTETRQGREAATSTSCVQDMLMLMPPFLFSHELPLPLTSASNNTRDGFAGFEKVPSVHVRGSVMETGSDQIID